MSELVILTINIINCKNKVFSRPDEVKNFKSKFSNWIYISNFHTKFTQLFSVEKNYSVLAEKVFVFFRCSKIRLSKFFCCLSSSKSSLESKIRPTCFWLVANWTFALLISKLNISFSCTYSRNWLLWLAYLCQG